MKSFLDLFVQICFKQHGCAQDIRESASPGAFEGKEEGRAKTSRYGNSIVQKMQVTRRSPFIQSLSGHVRINMDEIRHSAKQFGVSIERLPAVIAQVR